MWLQGLASTGTWDDIKKLRRPQKLAQGRLQNGDGVLMDSNERAEVLADYLQEVQWVGENVPLPPSRPPLWEQLPVDCGPIIPDEVKFVVTKLKGHATLCWDGVWKKIRRKNKRTFKNWDMMVEKLKGKFLPKDYQLTIFRSMQNLR